MHVLEELLPHVKESSREGMKVLTWKPNKWVMEAGVMGWLEVGADFLRVHFNLEILPLKFN